MTAKVTNPRYKVALFGGCLVDFVYPEQGEALLKLLQDQQVQVEYPLGQTCCGLPAKMMGEKDIAREVARQNLAAMDPADYDYILTLCASCGSHLKETYPKLLGEEPGLAVKAQQFIDKLIDFSSFMTQVLKVMPDEFQGRERKVAYHSPCHLCRGLGVMEEPRELLAMAGLDYRPGQRRGCLLRHGRELFRGFPGAVRGAAGEKAG